jgi:hypothetical protein
LPTETTLCELVVVSKNKKNTTRELELTLHCVSGQDIGNRSKSTSSYAAPHKPVVGEGPHDGHIEIMIARYSVLRSVFACLMLGHDENLYYDKVEASRSRSSNMNGVTSVYVYILVASLSGI